LARIKGAPAGTQGLSLFLVPKGKINPDGSLGEPNDVKVISIEKKLGLKGSPICHLSFGEEGKCIGELVGKENQGMRIFFTMMNESRLIAARHGAAVASTAYLHALAYARERLQGTEMFPKYWAGTIIKHWMSTYALQMKAYTEATRVLILYASYCMDRERMSHTKEERQEWERRTAFLTPVAKAYGSDISFRVTETAMQVYGGYGYMKDYPIEQFLRDEKAHSLFEGTNGIQALTLTDRNLGRDSEALFKGHLEDISKFCNENKGHRTLAQYMEILETAKNALLRHPSIVKIITSFSRPCSLRLPLFRAFRRPHRWLAPYVAGGDCAGQVDCTGQGKRNGARWIGKTFGRKFHCCLLQRQAGFCPLFGKHGAKPGTLQGSDHKKDGQGVPGNS
jgi:hypothetical protein